MASDGVLTQLYQHGYTVPGTAASPQLRARAAAHGVPAPVRRRVVAGRMTAAWIYGCAREPDRLALLVDAKRRISSLRSTRGCTLHEVRLGPFDVVSLGGLMVSSPAPHSTGHRLACGGREGSSCPAAAAGEARTRCPAPAPGPGGRGDAHGCRTRTRLWRSCAAVSFSGGCPWSGRRRTPRRSSAQH